MTDGDADDSRRRLAARTAPSWPSSPPGTRGRPRPGPRRLRRPARRHRAAAGHRLAVGDCALPAYDAGRRRPSTSPPSRPRPDGPRLRRPATPRCAGCPRPAAPVEPLLDPEEHRPRRRDPGDGASPTAPSSSASSAGARWSCCGCRWTAARPSRWSTGRSRCAGSARGGGVVVATVAHDRSAGELIAHHPGPPPAAHRLRRRAAGHRPGAPDAGADGDRARRLPGARLGHHAARARARTRCC